jgi:type II secretory pathway component PulF
MSHGLGLLMARISYSKLAKLFGRLKTSYAAGLDLRSVYEKESKSGNGTYRNKSAEVSTALTNGESLAHAMDQTDGYFPDLAVAVVQAGEEGGRLEDAFARLAKHYEGIVAFRNRFLMSIAWPMFELCASIFIVGALIWIMDWVINVASSGEMDPIDWFGMGSTWGNFLLYCGFVLTFFGGIFLVVFGSMKGWFGTYPMRLARRVPLLGKTIEHLALARFAWTMSVAENAGMSALDTAKLAIRSTENFYYKLLVPEVVYDLRQGKSFHSTLSATDAFPDDFLNYVETGETAGELSETMQKASADLQERAENNLKIIGTIGFVLTFAFVAILIAAVVITLYKVLYIDQLQKFANGI